MSRWRKLTKIIKTVAPIAAAVIPGGQGIALAAATKVAGASKVAKGAKLLKTVKAVRGANTAANNLRMTGAAGPAPSTMGALGPVLGRAVVATGGRAMSKIRGARMIRGARGVGRDIAVGTGAYALGGIIFDESGKPVGKVRRRSRGFSARDVRQAQRLMVMLKKMQAACPRPRSAGRSTGRIC